MILLIRFKFLYSTFMLDRWTLADHSDQRDNKLNSKWNFLTGGRPIDFEFLKYKIIIYLKEAL
jgi:hypothetical protein